MLSSEGLHNCMWACWGRAVKPLSLNAECNHVHSSSSRSTWALVDHQLSLKHVRVHMSRMQVGRGARLIQVIGPAVPVREEGGKPAGHIYQLNGVERGQARAQLGARFLVPPGV